MLRVGQLLVHVLVAGALGRIAGAALLRQHAERDAAGAQDLEQRAQRLLEVGLERAGAAEPDQHVVLRADRRSRAPADVDELLPLVVAEPPDVRRGARGCCTSRRDTRAPRRSTPARGARRSGSAGARCRPGTGSRRRRRSCTARAPSPCRPRRACVSRSPASSASCVCRMIVFGFSSLPAPHAGQFTWQRPHSTQVNASSTLLLPRSFTVSRPTCSFSKSRFGRLPSSGDFRNTVIGDSTRWKCFDAGISARNARITIACTHQFTRPASAALVEPERQQERDHQRRDEQRDDDRFDRHRACRAPTGRTNARRISR